RRQIVSGAVDPLRLYRYLRALNPAPYLFYLALDDVTFVGSSPEVLVRVEGDAVTVRPIAGTRPRGASAAEDEALAESLRGDAKELAEHRMLVDLGRNDVGRVAGYVGWGATSLDTAIAIRSALVLKDRVAIQAGAGIVADSDPAREFAETEAKAQAVLRALALAKAGD